MASLGGFLLYSSEYDGLEAAKRRKLTRIEELRHELIEAEARQTRVLKTVEATKLAAKEAHGSIEALREKAGQARLEIKEAESTLATHKARALVADERKRAAVDMQRTEAVGRIYPFIQLSNGVILQNAQITELSSTQLAFIHRGGESRVPWDQLPQEMITQFDLGTKPQGNTLFLTDKTAGHEEKIDDPFKKIAAERAAILAQMDEVSLQINRVQKAIDAANNKSAPNASVTQRLEDQKARLEVQLTRLRRKL